MATQIENNISSSKEKQSFVPEIEVDGPKDTLDIPKRVTSLETSVKKTPKG
jgi:hypothetical protein